MNRNRSSIIAIPLLACIIITLISCARRTTEIPLPLDSPETFSDSGTQAVEERWWTAFEDTALNALVDSALRSNFILETAWHRLHQAQAIADRESSFLYPDLEASFEGEAVRSEVRETEQLRLGLTSTYEIDLWGRIGSSVAAEQYRARAGYTDYQTAALSLSAEVVRTWYQLMEARNQQDLVQQQIETNEKVLSLIRTRFGSGQIRSVDILRQKELIEATREQRIVVEARIQVLENQLAVLMGRPPQEGLEYANKALPDLPPLPETGLPIELVRRRPDVHSAYNLLLAADRDMAAAISNQYPRLSLTGSVSTTGRNADNLFEDWVRSFAGNILAPIFYGGELSAEVDRSKALTKQRLYEYGQAVLVAFQEVGDALIQEKKQIERIRSIEEQVTLANQAYEQLRIEYLNGVSDYIDVLTALTDIQQLQRDLISSRLLLIEFRVALYRALAGGFETGRETAK